MCKPISTKRTCGFHTTKFAAICGGAGLFGFIAIIVSPAPKLIAPIVAIVFAGLPILWLMFKRSKRIATINKQLPEALELGAIAARWTFIWSGHRFGCQRNGSSHQSRIRTLLRRAEPWNIAGRGTRVDDASSSQSRRFFATAVLLQRQTGGDLAEILDKIGRLVRDRFRWLDRQIQALTGEGRLSGIVLLALLPVCSPSCTS